MAADPEPRTLTRGGVDLAYFVGGSGPPVILLHGFPQTYRCWDRVRKILEERMQVITPGLRGYAPSQAPEDLEAYAIDELVDDVVALAREVSDKRVHLVGHDWGGVIAWCAGSRYPDVFETLLIADAPHPDLFLRQALRHPSQLFKSWYIFAFQIPGFAETLLGSHSARRLRGVFKGSAVRPGAFTSESLRHYQDALGSPEKMRPPLLYYRSAFRKIVTGNQDELPPVEIPTTVLWGAQDHALGTYLLEGLEEKIEAEHTFTILENCGHWVPEEAPEETAQAIMDLALGPTASAEEGTDAEDARRRPS